MNIGGLVGMALHAGPFFRNPDLLPLIKMETEPKKVTEEDEAGAAWAEGVAKEWADGLQDSRQDIYTLEDGQPLDATS